MKSDPKTIGKIRLMERLRVDKWLWAARFYKTRSIAKTAIEGGKVHLDGQRVKVSREISIGERLTVKQGWDEKEVVVKALSDQRGPAPIAQTLYEETPESIERREREARRKVGRCHCATNPKTRKHERKALEKLRKQFDL